MRQFHTSVVERREHFVGRLASQPYEAGWASEAIFFVKFERLEGPSDGITLVVQIAADGIDWIDEGTIIGPIRSIGTYHVRVRHFGGWLRVVADLGDPGGSCIATVHLVLKE
jgi:hypothetical protein